MSDFCYKAVAYCAAKVTATSRLATRCSQVYSCSLKSTSFGQFFEFFRKMIIKWSVKTCQILFILKIIFNNNDVIKNKKKVLDNLAATIYIYYIITIVYFFQFHTFHIHMYCFRITKLHIHILTKMTAYMKTELTKSDWLTNIDEYGD